MSAVKRQRPGVGSPTVTETDSCVAQRTHRSDELRYRLAGVRLFVDAIASARPTLTEHDLLVRTALWINSGSYVPPSAVSTSKRAALLAAGLVTEATLRARQIY